MAGKVMNELRMSKEVAALLVDSMDEDTLAIHLQCYIAEDYLKHPENYTYEVEEVENLLKEEKENDETD